MTNKEFEIIFDTPPVKRLFDEVYLLASKRRNDYSSNAIYKKALSKLKIAIEHYK